MWLTTVYTVITLQENAQYPYIMSKNKVKVQGDINYPGVIQTQSVSIYIIIV